MESVGYILLKDIGGIKLAKTTIQRIMSGFSSFLPTDVLHGELLTAFKSDEYHYNYQLLRDDSILVFCSEEEIAPLNYHEIQILEGIKKPADRYSAFTSDKLEWGVNLKPGYSVYVTLPGPNLSVAPSSRATVHYVGIIGNDPGTQFGVEIMEAQYRNGQFGTTDGTFQGHRYFNCADDCGLFVSLHLLSQTPVTVCDPYRTHHTSHRSNQASDPVDGKKSYTNVLSSEKSFTQNSQSKKAEESSVYRSNIQQGMRVQFYDRKNKEYQGVVKWTGQASPGRQFDGIVLGIITDEPIFKSDFVDSFRGMDMNVPEAPAHCALFLPEVLVDPVTEGMNVESIAKELKVSKMELVKEQKEVLKEVSKVKVEQNVVKAAKTADVNMDDDNQQREAMEQFEREKKKRDQDISECGNDPNNDNTVPCINDQQESSKPYKAQQDPSIPRARGDQAKLRNNAQSVSSRKPHIYDDVQDENSPLNPDRLPHENVCAHHYLSQQGTPSSVDQQAYHDHLHQYNLRSWRAREDPSHVPARQDPSVPRAHGDQDLIQAQERKICEQAEILRVKNEEFQGLIQEKDGLIQEKDELIQEKDGLIQEKDGLIEEKDGLIRTLIRERDGLIQEKDKIIKTQQDVIESKLREITALQQRLDDCTGGFSLSAQESDSLQDKMWNISRDEVKRIPKKEIGHGAWGVVYSGNFRGEAVAIKQAHKEILYEETVKMLKREILIMAHIQHPNLVRFIAAVLDEDVERGKDSPIIISELLDMNLRVAYKKFDLGRSLIPIFRDVAYALHYLHQHHEPIIHRDVSAPNILLQSLPNNLYRAKVSDFGSANLVKQSSTAGAGAIVYCAPEMFPAIDISVCPPPQTTKVDIFSYGILLLEVILKKMPTSIETRCAMLQEIKEYWKMMYELIVHCTKYSPSDRPTMSDILNKLTRIPTII